MDYFSQFGEDRILAIFFADKEKGFCVEVGANDGVNDSNTLHFERRGWRCLLVEPNPELCEQIRASRTATVVECAASDRCGEVTLFVAEGAPYAHGVSTIHGGLNAREKIRSYGFSSREIAVVSRTLDDILQENCQDAQIDFMSIDVEGHELTVLKGLSLNRWRPSILLMEDNSNYEDPMVRNYLKQRGYVPFLRTGVNDWYASADNRKLLGSGRRVAYLRSFYLSRLRVRMRQVPSIMWLWRAWKRLRA